MLSLHPTTSSTSPARVVATLPGVPDSQARALDRRLQLHRQLRSFRSVDRSPLASINDPAGPARA